MDVNTRNRPDLKAFFVKNSIPTQSNFADLIDGMLNQKDDGLAKASNLPLSIEAAGAGVGDSEKKAIALYQSFSDSTPAWTLSLNPRIDQKDPKTAKLGFAISDGDGKSRLFVDRKNGNVGIGTLEPGKNLHIQGLSSAPLMNDKNDRPGFAVTGEYPQIDLFSAVANTQHGPTIRMGGYNDDQKSAFKQWVIGTSGRNSAFLDIGYSDKSDPNPHAGIRNYIGKTFLTILESGNVGIGTTAPSQQLEVVGNVKISGTIVQEEWITPPLLNGWTRYHDQWNPPGYFRDKQGIVHLRGLVKFGVSGVAIFALPAGYRPPFQELHAVQTNSNTIGRCDIDISGNVIMVQGNNGWFSLDGITFRAGAPVFTIMPGIPIINPFIVNP